METGGWVALNDLMADLRPTPVPDANQPLMTSVLHVDERTGGSCLLVSFPPGWERGAGVYTCAEYAVVVEGAIELDGDLWQAGTSFVVPADAPRRRTYAPNGALAVAWFAGPPRWTSGGAPDAEPSSSRWDGDTSEATVPGDDVDVQARRWRHVAAGTPLDPAYLRYSWVH